MDWMYYADGLLRLENDALILEYRMRDTMGNPTGPAREVTLPLFEIEALEWRRGPLGGLFGNHVVVRVRRLGALEKVPGAKGGYLKFRIARADREEAKRFASQARLELSGMRLRELEAE